MVIIKIQTPNKCSEEVKIMLSIVLKTLFEFLLVGFAIWALFNEDRFIAFEEKLFSAIRRRRLKVRQGGVSGRGHRVYENR